MTRRPTDLQTSTPAASTRAVPRESVEKREELAAIAPLLDLVAAKAAEIVLERLGELATSAPVSPYLNVDEAAEYLRCDRQRIYDLLSARRLPKFKDGSRVLVRRADLDELVAPSLPPGVRARSTSGVAA